MPELIIFDIGHGNLGVLLDTSVTLFDCGPNGPTSARMLKELTLEKIDQVLISHPDADHIGGLPDLINTFSIDHVWLNPDPSKKGESWYEYVGALGRAETSGTKVHVGLTTLHSRQISSGEVEIEILAPSTSFALTGVGGKYLGKHTLRSNTLSVVIRLIHQSCPVVLLPGDLDAFGLEDLIARRVNLEAKILVFPHHGGSCGEGDDYTFAFQLASLVKPELVLFSLHRSRHDNPRQEIVEGLCAACPNVHIIARKCAPTLPDVDFTHLNELPALGYANNSCCGGTIHLTLNGAQTVSAPDRHAHRTFVTSLPHPLCLRSRVAQA